MTVPPLRLQLLLPRIHPHHRTRPRPRRRNPICVIALIDERQVVEKILRYLAVWHDPPPSPNPEPAGVLASRRGREFRGPYRQLEMSQAEAHYLWRQPSLREHKI